MVTASFIVQPSIKVQLPRASKADVAVTHTGVTLKADGSLLLNGRPVREAQLRDELTRQARFKREVQVIIAGDAGVRHGRVVRVIDIIRRAGVTRFAINVQIDERTLDHLER
jgi:biopolymer transport protein ExbD